MFLILIAGNATTGKIYLDSNPSVVYTLGDWRTKMSPDERIELEAKQDEQWIGNEDDSCLGCPAVSLDDCNSCIKYKGANDES